MNQNRFRAFLQQGNNAAWCIFVLFASTLMTQIVLFHVFCFNSFTPSDGDIFRFWLSKSLAAVFIACFIFLCRNQWWTIIVSIIIALWFVANIIYFRANNLFLDIAAISMANNLQGYESSIKAYFEMQLLFLFLPAICYAFVSSIIGLYTNRRALYTLYILITIIILIPFMLLPTWKNDFYRLNTEGREIAGESAIRKLYNNTKTLFIPFYQVRRYAKPGLLDPPINWEITYINDNSVLQYIPAMVIYHIVRNSFYKKAEITTQDLYSLEHCLSKPNHATISPSVNMIILLVESLESWALEVTDSNGYPILPNLSTVIGNEHTLYCSKIKSQVKHGVSGDGQMIVNTGLLPINIGAACMLFPDNTYPNFAHFYNSSVVINTTPEGWNKDKTMYRYGYKDILNPKNGIAQDEWATEQLSDLLLQQSQDRFCYLVLTVSTHAPFNRIKDRNLALAPDMPPLMRSYLNCLHYTDSCIGAFLSTMPKENTVLLITGDHTVFKEHLLKEFQPFTTKYNLSVKNGKNYCPLIVYSPSIKENITIEEECYQMDIYPTILSLIGAENYYWKGFGVNLLDSTTRRNRFIYEEKAYILSDKLIRCNWFTKIND